MKYLYFLILLLIPFYIYDKPYGQHYSLSSNTPIWFYIPDQLPYTKGKVIYLWGYYPMIKSKYGLIEFNDAIWEIGYE